MTECVKIKCDDCKFVEDCVDYGWEGCRKFTPKFPLCDGKGKYKNGLGVVSRCYYCLGTGEINDKCERVKTNEEWLRSCTTEELVKMILDLCDDRPCFACGIGYCEDENWCHVYSDEAKEFVMDWLKQPHTFK